MDLQVVYLNNKTVFPSISSYEEFIEEVKKLEPYSSEIAVSYVDEEGDEIQVSNSSDLVAIVDTKSVVLRLDIKIDEDKKKKDEARKQKIKQEQRAKRQEALQAKIHNIQEMLAEDQAKLNALKHDSQQFLDNLTNQLQEAANWKPQELPDILELIAKQGVIEQIKEKENQLIHCDGKKEFNTQLKTITQEIHAIFHNVYAQRVNQINANYVQAKEKQGHQDKLIKEIEAYKKKSIDHVAKISEKIAIHQGELDQKRKELEQLNEQ